MHYRKITVVISDQDAVPCVPNDEIETKLKEVFPEGVLSIHQSAHTFIDPICETINLVCEEFGVTMEALRGPRGRSNISQPRQICIWLLREIAPLIGNPSDDDIASVFNRERTIVYHSAKSAADLELTDESTWLRVVKIKRQILTILKHNKQLNGIDD